MTYSSIPEKTIRLIPLPGNESCTFSEYIQRAQVTRDWFDSHVYRCLPLAIANQYGFIIYAPFDFSFIWNGGQGPEDVQVSIDEPNVSRERRGIVNPKSSFGRGIMTIYPGFVLKTAPNMNLLVKNPPNFYKDNTTWLEGVVETDNLNTTFSYNIKIHIPNERISIKQGDPIGCFFPYPRFFFDDFQLEVSQDPEELDYYGRKQNLFGVVRNNYVETGNYRKGKDFDGCPFHSHQITVNKPTKQGE
jgi:hypothetical protein